MTSGFDDSINWEARMHATLVAILVDIGCLRKMSTGIITLLIKTGGQ
jgi:hypothetical protein